LREKFKIIRKAAPWRNLGVLLAFDFIKSCIKDSAFRQVCVHGIDCKFEIGKAENGTSEFVQNSEAR
jgi:hypothetical protein